jgi:UDP-N-acetylglucosamine--N-acetylmuramyl-(pentapeptide) pyrophosphoryl-undecaprenol N-acetylglucosamine transferase
MALVNKKAAVIIEEKNLTGRALGNAIDSLVRDKKRFAEISKNAREMAVIDATSRICDIVLDLIKS